MAHGDPSRIWVTVLCVSGGHDEAVGAECEQDCALVSLVCCDLWWSHSMAVSLQALLCHYEAHAESLCLQGHREVKIFILSPGLGAPRRKGKRLNWGSFSVLVGCTRYVTVFPPIHLFYLLMMQCSSCPGFSLSHATVLISVSPSFRALFKVSQI